MDEPCGVPMQLSLNINGEVVSVEVLERKGHSLRFALNGTEYHFICRREGSAVQLDQEIAPGVWRRVRGASWRGKGVHHIQLGGHDFAVADASRVSATQAEAPLSPRAPMPGLVRQVLVKKGDKVASGQALVVMEAMKLQLTLSAGGDGVVEAVLVSAGEMVPENAELVRVKA